MKNYKIYDLTKSDLTKTVSCRPKCSKEQKTTKLKTSLFIKTLKLAKFNLKNTQKFWFD